VSVGTLKVTLLANFHISVIKTNRVGALPYHLPGCQGYMLLRGEAKVEGRGRDRE